MARKAGQSLRSTKSSKHGIAKLARAESVPISESLPPKLLLLPVNQTTLFPGMIVPLILPEGKLTKTVEHVMEQNGYIGVILYKNSNSANVATGPTTSMTGIPVEGSVYSATGKKSKGDDFHRFGVAAKILKKINLPDNQISVLLTGLQRFELKDLVSRDPYYAGNVAYLNEKSVKGTELEAMLRSALSQFKQISKDNPLISEEMKVALVNIDGPGKLADFMASVLIRDVIDYQEFLASPDVNQRLQQLLVLLKKEQDVQAVQKRIQDEINQKVSSAQREFYLQEQLKFIQKELGRESDDRTRLVQKFKDRLALCQLSEEAKKRIDEEMEKLGTLHEQSSEFSVCINYLDWASALPWGVRSDEIYDLKAASKKLDEDHYGLKNVKDRILEFLAVKKLKASAEGTILCFVGPPGTGKTSLGKSIARALNRKFFRFSVGGMRDEAEIKGHRRTYVGAMPGKMIQGLKRAGTKNPVFLIDEVDKIGNGAYSGDPASALLELLDPEQNSEFLDHYLDIPFDCSEVFFITTANSTDSIPSALLDRMEIIHLSGYTDNEKYHISRNYLIPKQLKKNSLKASQLKFAEVAVRHIISHYARESGVRNLEKQIAKICRKVALRIALGKTQRVVLDKKLVEKFLGMAPFTPEQGLENSTPGVATGLAWTQYGGEILFVESRSVPGKGGFTLTGSLGEVMKESASLAYTYVRDHVKELKLSEDYFEKHMLHVHVPAGAIPKDGPSAGVTMVASLYSLLSGRPVKSHLGMTGEVTLTGRVLPVGGIKEKLLASRRANLTTILLPKLNARDLKEIEPEVKDGLKFIQVANLDECLRHLFH